MEILQQLWVIVGFLIIVALIGAGIGLFLFFSLTSKE